MTVPLLEPNPAERAEVTVAGGRDRQQWSVVFRSVVMMLVVVSSTAACGSSGSPAVSAVDSERSLAGASGPATTVDTDRPVTTSTTVRAPSDAEEVDTVVIPDVVERPSSIAVVGDSLTLSARDEIMSALEPTGMEVLAVDGLESRRMTHGGSNIPPGTDAIEEIRAETEPGMWVIALGTNDVASVGSLDDFRVEMRTVLDAIPPDVPVIWVDLWIGDREELVSRANLRIRAELSERSGGAAVVDWYSYGDDDGVITSDGVHLTNDGQVLFAESIVAAVEELFPAT